LSTRPGTLPSCCRTSLRPPELADRDREAGLFPMARPHSDHFNGAVQSEFGHQDQNIDARPASFGRVGHHFRHRILRGIHLIRSDNSTGTFACVPPKEFRTRLPPDPRRGPSAPGGSFAFAYRPAAVLVRDLRRQCGLSKHSRGVHNTMGTPGPWPGGARRWVIITRRPMRTQRAYECRSRRLSPHLRGATERFGTSRSAWPVSSPPSAQASISGRGHSPNRHGGRSGRFISSGNFRMGPGG